MIITILLTVLTIVFAVWEKRDDMNPLPFIGVVFTPIVLVVHLGYYVTKGYRFNLLEVERITLVESLEYSRKSGNEIESAAILKEIVDLNSKIAELKYNNGTFFFDQYIDDKIENLETVK